MHEEGPNQVFQFFLLLYVKKSKYATTDLSDLRWLSIPYSEFDIHYAPQHEYTDSNTELHALVSGLLQSLTRTVVRALTASSFFRWEILDSEQWQII